MLAQIPIANLDAGSTVSHLVQARVPAAFGVDERQSERAELLIGSAEGDLDGDNDVGYATGGGMPVPQGLQALSLPGDRFVNVSWTSISDDRIAGYRICVETEDGRAVPIGSSFHPGFTDLSARFGQMRAYRVSTYSARGIESELSEALLASPAQRVVLPDGPKGEHVFGNGFEAVTTR